MGACYKFELRNRHSKEVVLKGDPYGRQFELRPATASLVHQSSHEWGDEAWMEERARRDWLRQPCSIYEA